MSIDTLVTQSPKAEPVQQVSVAEAEGNGTVFSLSSPDEEIRTVASGSSQLNSGTKNKVNNKRPLIAEKAVSKQGSKKAKTAPASEGADGLENGSTEKSFYCHHCRQKRGEDRVLTCSMMVTTTTKGGSKTACCGKSFCSGCLQRQYDTDMKLVKGGQSNALPDEQHDRSGPYIWTCPHCRGTCKSTSHNKKRESEISAVSKVQVGESNLQEGVKSNGTAKQNGLNTDHTRLNTTNPPTPSAPHAFSNLFPQASTSVTPVKASTLDGDKSAKVAKTKKVSPTKIPTKSGSEAKVARKSTSKAVTKAAESVKAKPAPKKTKKEKKNDEVAGSGESSLTPEPTSVNGTVNGPQPHDPKKKQRPSHVFSLDFDSDSSLTPPAEGDSKKVSAPAVTKATKPAKHKTAKQAGSVKAEGVTKTKTDGKGKGKGKEAAAVKGVPKGKGKAKEAVAGEKKPRAKPVKKVEKPVEPPVFEKVDTRLGHVEAEQKIMLREYLHRFRPILSIPERSLPPLEDFDRPPTEASIKLFAGAMLDLIKEELEQKGDEKDEDIIDTITRFREELRYYGDLARFANAYKTLEGPLGLKMPKAVLPETRGSANVRAVRALLDLQEHEAVPAWAEAGPSRRTGASRLPQPSEVIRMLLALAERTLSSPAVRTDLVWEAPENEARRVHAREQKKENDQWEIKSKKMGADGVRCKTAAATKAHKELVDKETKEHKMRLALANVNLRAALGIRALRHGPLGVDLDGRVYYCLAHRPVDDDTRPPHGWASGLLVWGVGLPPKPDAPLDEDELPPMVERWCHFGQSADVRQLVKWLEYRTRKAVEAAQPAKTPTKPKTTPGMSKVANGNTPKTAGSSKQLTLDFKATPSISTFGPTATPSKSSSKKKLLEVCIPVNKASRASTDDEAEVEGDNSSTSDLSELSDAEDEELLSHLLPEGYRPSVELIKEEGIELAKKVAEVAEWLEVLEWKGMGEVVK